MKRSKGLLLILLAIPSAVFICMASTYFYTTLQVEIAKRAGVYPTPEDSMRALIAESWVGVQRIEIEHAGTNSFDGSHPHVWFVIARVWAEGRSDGKPMSSAGHEGAGSLFLRTEDGWVHVPEGFFPELVGLGMELFGMVPDS